MRASHSDPFLPPAPAGGFRVWRQVTARRSLVPAEQRRSARLLRINSSAKWLAASDGDTIAFTRAVIAACAVAAFAYANLPPTAASAKDGRNQASSWTWRDGRAIT